MSISVIIPVLREQHRINGLIDQVRAQDAMCEIIVVDGDPAGSTLAMISDLTVVRLTAPRGRGSQLSSGAARATGMIILMLHADTRLPDNGLRMISDAVKDGGKWGAFKLGIDAEGVMFRIIERSVDLRCRLFSLPYGDQALYATRQVLQRAGGIPDIPLMEDVALVRRLKQVGGACRLLPCRVKTSARRWQQDGVLARTFRNWRLLIRYLAGADPSALAKEYP